MQPEGGPSRTAQFVALFRALESRLPAKRRLFEDPYAHAFLGGKLGAVHALAGLPLSARLVNRTIDRGWPGTRVGIVVRTRFIDDALTAALADGVGQVAILGSGFDTRAYRVPGIERTRVFEIDSPATLPVKRARMESLVGRVPPHVSMVAIDFEREDLEEALARTDFQPQEPAFFIWEGVTSYLSDAAVDATLRHLAALAAPGSRLAFTYLDQAMLNDGPAAAAARSAIATVRRAGEPFRFGFDPAGLSTYLSERAFELREDTTTADLAARYLHPLGRRPSTSRSYHVALAAR